MLTDHRRLRTKIARWVAGLGGACFLFAIQAGIVLQAFGVKGAIDVGEVVCVLGAAVGFLTSYWFLDFPPKIGK